MSQAILLDLEHQRKRLDFYVQLKTETDRKVALNPAPVVSSKKAAPTKAAPQGNTLDTWIEIYSERVKKLENQAIRLGLVSREQLKAAKGAHVFH